MTLGVVGHLLDRSLARKVCSAVALGVTAEQFLSGHADTTNAVIYFFRRGSHTLTCETRLDPEGACYQLVIVMDGRETIEPFHALADLLSREHELLQAWRAQGWGDVGPPPAKQRDSWKGPG